MLSDQQLEIAARELCRLRGIDPDKLVPHVGAEANSGGLVCAVLLHSPAWRLAAEHIQHAVLIQAAIQFAERETGPCPLKSGER